MTLEGSDGDHDVELSMDGDLLKRVLELTNLHKVYLPFLLRIPGFPFLSLSHGALCLTMIE